MYRHRLAFFYPGVIFLLAYLEEGLRDMTVWKEHVSLFSVFHLVGRRLHGNWLVVVVYILGIATGNEDKCNKFDDTPASRPGAISEREGNRRRTLKLFSCIRSNNIYYRYYSCRLWPARH